MRAVRDTDCNERSECEIAKSAQERGKSEVLICDIESKRQSTKSEDEI